MVKVGDIRTLAPLEDPMPLWEPPPLGDLLSVFFGMLSTDQTVFVGHVHSSTSSDC